MHLRYFYHICYSITIPLGNKLGADAISKSEAINKILFYRKMHRSGNIRIRKKTNKWCIILTIKFLLPFWQNDFKRSFGFLISLVVNKRCVNEGFFHISNQEFLSDSSLFNYQGSSRSAEPCEKQNNTITLAFSTMCIDVLQKPCKFQI